MLDAMHRRLRVLCTSTPGTGHVSALAPVAKALRDRGHEVSWAVAPEGGAAVAAMGFEWSPLGSRRGPARPRRAGRDHGAAERRRRRPLFAAVLAREAGPMIRTS